MRSRTSVSSSAKRRDGFFRGRQTRNVPPFRTRPLAVESLEGRLLLSTITLAAGANTLKAEAQAGNATEVTITSVADDGSGFCKFTKNSHGLAVGTVVKVYGSTNGDVDGYQFITAKTTNDFTTDKAYTAVATAGKYIVPDGPVAQVKDNTPKVIGGYLIATEGLVTINGNAGTAETLKIDFANGNPLPQGAGGKVVFDGDTGNDKLEVNNGTFTTVTTTYTGTGDGKIGLDGDMVEFKNLAPLTFGGTAANRIFNLPLGPNTDVVIQNNGALASGSCEITSASFENTTFTNPTESLTVNLGPLGDKVTVNTMDNGFKPTRGFNVVGGPSADSLVVTTVAADLTLIRRNHDGQSGSVKVNPATNPAKYTGVPVIFRGVESVSASAGRLVEFDADPLETNNIRQNATPFDLLSQLHVQPTIDPGGDQDWYAFVASEKSSYEIELDFEPLALLPGGGDLQLQVYKWDPVALTLTVITPIAGTNNYLLSEGPHYLKVSGVTADDANLYSLKITNTRVTFESGAGQFKPLSGLWTIDREGSNASYRGAADPKANAIAQFMGAVPTVLQDRSFEVTIKADEMIAGPRWSNAFIVFDFDPANPNNDFKFAGAFMGIDKWSIGERANNANGYIHLIPPIAQRFDANTDYRIRVDLIPLNAVIPTDTRVELYVHNGFEWSILPVATYDFLAADGNAFTFDSVGLLTMRGIAWFDDFADPAPDGVAAEPEPGGDGGEPEPVELNAVPVARIDSAATAVGQAVTIDVLANDSDADGDPLVPSLVTAAAHGTVAPNPDGSFLYTPEPGFSGTDGFTYKVSDGQADSAPAAVSIVVERPNGAPLAARDEATTDEDAAVTVDVLANDSDPDGDPLSVVSFTQAAHGTVVQAGGGALRYTPRADFDQTDSFTYTVSDGRGGTAVGTVEIAVTPVNDPPAATADALSVAEDAPGTIDVTANDSDPENDPIVVTGYTQGANGTVDMPAGDGRTVRYTPAPGFRGVDSFDYTISDGHGGADTATVSVSVGGMLYEEDFDQGTIETPQVEIGTWRIVDDPGGGYAGDRCYLAAAPAGGVAVAARALEGSAALDLAVQATFNADDIVPGKRWSNAFVIFDYQGPTDFKFAGAFVGIDKWVIGHSAGNADGYVVDAVFSEKIDALTDYAIQVVVEDDTVTLAVHDGRRYVSKVFHSYSGSGGSLQDGAVGLGTMRGTARFDDLRVEATDRVFGDPGNGP